MLKAANGQSDMAGEHHGWANRTIGQIHDVFLFESSEPAAATLRPGVLIRPDVSTYYDQPAGASPRSLPSPRSSRRTRSNFLYTLGVVVFVAGLGLSTIEFMSNHIAQAKAKEIYQTINQAPPPSTTRPSAESVSSYKVAPDLPRFINISSLGVHARIFSIGTNNTSELDIPRNVFDAGWYSGSSKPGQAGAMLIDGHISSWTTPGIFYDLKKLSQGDMISIERGDGRLFSFKVVDTKIYDTKNVDMANLLVSADTSKPGLNLISCTGSVIPGTNSFDKRIAVFAVEQ